MPALAIADELRRTRPDWRIVLAGAERGLEARLLPTRSFPFRLLPAEPLYRRQPLRNLRWPFILPRLLRSVEALLDEERPAVVVGTGGYAAAPVIWRAARRGIPTTMLELNAFPGLAVRLLARRVRELWLGSPEARGHLRIGPATEIVDTGAPIVPPDPALRQPARGRFGLAAELPVLLVTGGSQGALAINEVIAAWLRSGGGAGVQVLWTTGRHSYERYRDLHRPPAVQVYDFLDPMAPAYAVADLAVSRAGMMTLAELAAWGIPALVVPLPTAAADHQTPNARAVEAAGAGIHVPQPEFTVSRLSELVDWFRLEAGVRQTMSQAARNRGRPGATAEIVARIGVLSG
jgi:UDP-N-acetylglucosamine--N-acetylmuramyl-(pentapeptide) pyrophosphoryl-undecaprenol N-acetylglucosamine transferase